MLVIVPTAGPVYGSSATTGTGGAVMLAAQDAKAKLAKLVGASPTVSTWQRRCASAVPKSWEKANFTLPDNAPFNADSAGTLYVMKNLGRNLPCGGYRARFRPDRLRRAVGSYSAGVYNHS
jgi:hypothetical protein